MIRKQFLGVIVAGCVGPAFLYCGDTDPQSISRSRSAPEDTALHVTDGFLPLPVGTAEAYTMTIADVRGAADFAFQTTRTADVSVSLATDDKPEARRLIQIREVRDGQAGRVLFRALTDEAGKVAGNLTVVSTADQAQLDFEHGGRVYTVPVELDDLKKLDRGIRMNPAALTPDASGAATASTTTLPDGDGDGVPDAADDFPDDASRATRVLFPTEGRYTVAFEDLYPRKGDADFNDYVIQARQEEHLNSAGNVVRILGSYRHVAKAAGYNHILRLTLPIPAADFSIRRYGADGALLATTNKRATPFEKIDITDRSDRTIAQSNADRGQTFRPGELFEIEIMPDAPVAKSVLGGAPYDLHVYVLNTRREIHFAGKFTNGDGSDPYLDDDGFPWALLVPIDWRWMYERQNIFTAYEFFTSWYTSAGANNADWYNFPDLSVVFGGVTGSYSSRPQFLPPPGYDPGAFVVSESLRPLPLRIRDRYVPVGAVFDIEPLSGGSIEFPGALGEIHYSYDRDALLDAGLAENFVVLYYDEARDAWFPVEETAFDAATETVIARTSHLTPYVLAVNTMAAELPVIVSWEQPPTSVAPNATVSLWIEAYDPEGRPLSFDWTASGGTLNSSFESPNGANTRSSITWTAPACGEDFLINVVVRDDDVPTTAYSFPEIDTTLSCPQGNDWVVRAQGYAGGVFSIAYGNGMFVAGSHGQYFSPTNNNGYYISNNGVDWSPVASRGTDYISSVTYGNGMFVSVGGISSSTAPPYSLYDVSADGLNWTAPEPRTIPNVFLEGVRFGNGMFVAAGSSGQIFYSNNGLNWTAATTGSGCVFKHIAFSGSEFVAVSGGTVCNHVLRSPDGISWSMVPLPSASPLLVLNDVEFLNGQFVAVGFRGVVFTSINGASWQDRSPPYSSELQTLFSVVYGPGQYTAFGHAGNILRSTDGITWEPARNPFNFGQSVCFFDAVYVNGMYVAAGADCATVSQIRIVTGTTNP